MKQFQGQKRMSFEELGSVGRKNGVKGAKSREAKEK